MQGKNTLEFLSVEQDGRALWIWINRESKLNALSIGLLKELRFVVDQGLENDSVGQMVISGKGEKAFAAGADIAEFANFSEEQGREMSLKGHEVMNIIESSFKPIIAMVNGFALGGGCELAMACHIRICSDNARFGQPEVNLGVPPGYGGTQRLMHLVGKGRALNLLLTGKTIDAEEALKTGLVTDVVPQAELIEKCTALLKKLDRKSPSALSMVIDCVNKGTGDYQVGLNAEIDAFGRAFGTMDFKEGTQAFLEKRKPDFPDKEN